MYSYNETFLIMRTYIKVNGKPKKLYSIKHPLPFFRRGKKKYLQHKCDFECSVDIEQNLIKENASQFIITKDSVLKPHDNPFFVPLYFDFKRKDDYENAIYLSPCGVELNNLEEIYNYLITTNSKLCVNQFSTDSKIELFRNHKYFKVYAYKKDISEGKEVIPIECINEIDNQLPSFTYTKDRISNVSIESQSSYSCTCLDDCANKSNCECQQLTIIEHKILNENNNVGYNYKFLPEIIFTAIYECNSQCSCKVNCLNRVVQNGLKVRLQLFKTKSRGWSIRCLHDIPKGTFICTYEGELIEKKSNINTDNKYLMQLNYSQALNKIIKLKKIFDQESFDEQSDEDSIFISENKFSSFSDITLSTSISSSTSSNESEKFEILENKSKRILKQNSSGKIKKFKNLKQETIECDYLIDSESTGNISRFFNHSCNPNMAIQNVFIEKNDKSVPHLAFFTLKDVNAFKELTFNYLFDNEKDLGFKCKCKSTNCLSKKNFSD